MEKDYLKYLKERFGFKPEDFRGFLFTSDKKRVYVTNEDVALYDDMPKKIHAFGIVAGKTKRGQKVIKPTSNFFQMFGHNAKRGVVEIDEEEMQMFVRGLSLEKPEESNKISPGYVIVKWKEHIIGCGLLKDGVIHNQLPKSRLLKIREEDIIYI